MAMRILALETTDRDGSLAAATDDNLLAELTLERTQQSTSRWPRPWLPCSGRSAGGPPMFN